MRWIFVIIVLPLGIIEAIVCFLYDWMTGNLPDEGDVD